MELLMVMEKVSESSVMGVCSEKHKREIRAKKTINSVLAFIR